MVQLNARWKIELQLLSLLVFFRVQPDAQTQTAYVSENERRSAEWNGSGFADSIDRRS